MTSYLSRLSPVPAFPSYTGPHKVGTVDVEIPIADLYSPAPCPENAKHIKTVQFRVFYPAAHDSNGKKIPWLPNPQRAHVAGYAGFLGMGSRLAEFASFLPRHLHYANIPVIKNAHLLSPSQAATPELPSSDSESTTTDTEAAGNTRWPTVIFSHGLGGSRNAYSHIAGSLASHGLVVFCPEHRDGSSVVSFIRDPDYVPSLFSRQSSSRTVVPYIRVAHEEKPEISEVRDEQLRIRCWEMGLIHDAIIKLDKGVDFRNLNTSTPTDKILQFKDTLKIHNPGDIIFAGHSFGAGMTVQFLKSVFYHDHPTVKTMKHPLYVPDPLSALVNQITPQTVTILLDMWCFPLVSPWTPELWPLPLPAYSSPSPTSPSAPAPPGGAAILAIESESFYKWTNHLHAKARAISPRPTAHIVSPTHFSESETGLHLPEPRFFYVRNSAHLNQSDFGVLFPWMTKKVFGAAEPERVLRLNMRAMLQHLRTNGIRVARTWVGDLVEDLVEGGTGKETKEGAGNMSLEGVEQVEVEGISDDKAIFERDADAKTVDYWHWIDVVGLGGESRIRNSGGGESEGESTTDVSVGGERYKDEEREMEGVIEPKLEPKDVAATTVTSAL